MVSQKYFIDQIQSAGSYGSTATSRLGLNSGCTLVENAAIFRSSTPTTPMGTIKGHYLYSRTKRTTIQG